MPENVDLVFPSNFFAGEKLGCLDCYFALFEIQISGINILLCVGLMFVYSQPGHTRYIFCTLLQFHFLGSKWECSVPWKTY